MRALLSVLLLGLITFSTPSLALFGKDQFNSSQNNSFGSSSDSFVPVDQAFPFNFYQQDDKLMLDWQVRDGYYLYQERLSVAGEKVSLGELQMEDGTPHKDEFFGDVHIYTQPLFVNVPMYDWQDGARVVVQYQGCAKAGFCYPPETRVIPISAFTSSNSDSTTATTASKAEQAPTATPPAVQSSSSADTPSAPVTQQDSLAANLADNWWTPLLFLALGVGLAFTPCVLPMYPILTSIVLGSGKLSQRRALGLSFVYVQGMALTYTLLGLVVASAGMQFQAAMQHPYVLIGLSVLFIALALSMFGLYSLQLPSNVQTWLNNLSNKQQGGSSAGVFAMGGDFWTGVLTMYHSASVWCATLRCTKRRFAYRWYRVIRAGDGHGYSADSCCGLRQQTATKSRWLDGPSENTLRLYSACRTYLLTRTHHARNVVNDSVVSTGYCCFWLAIPHQKQSRVWWLETKCRGIIAVLGLLASAQPILNYWFGNSTTQTQQATVSFTRIANVAELEEQLALAKAAGKPVMLDFYADWCVACKEFEKYTFHDPSVEAKLQDFVLLQADVTKNQVQDIELLKHMSVLGLPTIEFWDASGEHVSNARLTGFMQAEPFLEHIKQF